MLCFACLPIAFRALCFCKLLQVHMYIYKYMLIVAVIAAVAAFV